MIDLQSSFEYSVSTHPESRDISLFLLVNSPMLFFLSVFESNSCNKLHLTGPRKVSSHYQAEVKRPCCKMKVAEADGQQPLNLPFKLLFITTHSLIHLTFPNCIFSDKVSLSIMFRMSHSLHQADSKSVRVTLNSYLVPFIGFILCTLPASCRVLSVNSFR